jgi:hypothetical protein
VFILTQTDWCEQGSNASYCAGPLLQLVQLSEIYGDSKTFSDKPTRLGVNQTFEAFGGLPQNATYGDVLQFAEEYFVSHILRLFLFLAATPVFLGFLPTVSPFFLLYNSLFYTETETDTETVLRPYCTIPTTDDWNQTGEGQELNPVTIQNFNSTAAVLDQIDDQFYKGFVSLVNGYWALLIRWVLAFLFIWGFGFWLSSLQRVCTRLMG